MRICFNYTLTQKIATEETFDNLIVPFIDMIEKAYKDKNYKLVYQSVGLNVNATRRHHHINTVIETEQKDIKNWDSRVLPLIQEWKSKNKEKVDVYLSIWRTDDPKFELRRLIGYPLKEYEKFNQIVYLQYFVGLSHEEIEEYRKLANEIYQKAKYEYLKNKEKKLLEEETTDNKYEYITKTLDLSTSDKILERDRFKNNDIRVKINIVKSILFKYQKLQFHQNNKKVFKLSAIKELAISYLYFMDLCNEDELNEL